ncbi:hypothetical protein PULV_b0164 [Pseudoalteromonas ulvae UL12]|nr:hypothetical protein [Pseudoalteromonas ulvae UL12]
MTEALNFNVMTGWCNNYSKSSKKGKKGETIYLLSSQS